MIYFDPRDSEAMATTMLGVINNPSQRSAWIEKGMLQAAKFNWSECAKITLKELEGLRR